jgi:hypothetical protein
VQNKIPFVLVFVSGMLIGAIVRICNAPILTASDDGWSGDGVIGVSKVQSLVAEPRKSDS